MWRDLIRIFHHFVHARIIIGTGQEMPATKRKPLVLRKHRGAIQINGSLSLVQRKLAVALLFNAYWELPDHAITHHTISVRDLAALAGVSRTNRKELRKALVELTRTTIEWDILNEANEKVWGVSAFLAGAEIQEESDLCQYAYSPFLRGKLYAPEHFARINLAALRTLRSSYAAALYECCALYKDWLQGTGLCDIDTWKKLLGVGDHYVQFRDFNSKVLKPSIRQINAYTDIEIYEVTKQRQNRRIVKLGFKVRTNPKLNLFRGALPPADEAAALQADQRRRPQKTLSSHGRTCTEEERELCRALRDHGIGSSRHDEILSQCSPDQIRYNLLYASRHLKDHPDAVNNPGGWTAQAILDDYAGTRDGRLQRREEAQQQKQEEIRLRREKARADAMKRAEEARAAQEHRVWMARVQEWFKTWPEDEQARFDAQVRGVLVRQGHLDPANPYGDVSVRQARWSTLVGMLKVQETHSGIQTTHDEAPA